MSKFGRPAAGHTRRTLGYLLAAGAGLLLAAQSAAGGPRTQAGPSKPPLLLLGIGDSLTHGTMDATNNATNTRNAYFEHTARSLRQVFDLEVSQPLFDVEENRIRPFQVPTNLGVDGADLFSIEGLEYYKRVGAEESFVDEKYLCDARLPAGFEDKYDKVLYPINRLARAPVSQLDALVHLIERNARGAMHPALVIDWIGNNDSSTAALGSGGENPSFLPIPFEQSKAELSPGLRALLSVAEQQGDLSFAPYTAAAITRNLTEAEDFAAQLERVLDRLEAAAAASPSPVDVLVLTLPYYSAVGYLFDSEDLEFYLRKLVPGYTVPPSFARVAPPDEPITDPLAGDRVSLLTFGFMYALLSTGHSVAEVNSVLEVNGAQADGLVMSQAEQQQIITRINQFNDAIKAAVAARGAPFHLVDVGQFINDAFTGDTEIVVDGVLLTRKWGRGQAFTLDGVHPGYTAQAVIANFVIEAINAAFGTAVPLRDPSAVRATDPYADLDGDGWVPGPGYTPSGISELLFLFRDPDDGDPNAGAVLADDVWDTISRVLLGELLGIPALRTTALRLGIVGAE